MATVTEKTNGDGGEGPGESITLHGNDNSTTAPKEKGKDKSSSTLYPKIFRLANFVDYLEYKQELRPEDARVHLTGSIELHGIHVDVVFESPTSEHYRLQSRTQLNLVAEKDVAGFATFMSSLGPGVLLPLRDRIVQRYRHLNLSVDVAGEIVVAGEWCGKGVQKKVAVGTVDKFFAIVSINVNGGWIPDWQYTDISNEEHRVFHIGKAGFLTHTLDLNDLSLSEWKIEKVVRDVERSCPFAKAAFAASGAGEGIVWKATVHCEDPQCWFKSKGDDFAVSKLNKLPAAALAKDNPDRVKNFAAAIVTKARLVQGWDNTEQKGEAGREAFQEWILNNSYLEENRDIQRLQIPKQELHHAINDIAETWFRRKTNLEDLRLDLETRLSANDQ